MEHRGRVYKPPSDNEPDRDDEWDETRNVSPVRPRQSLSQPKQPVKPRKEFYSDEHPEVPKIRRASLKQTHIEVLPQASEGLSEHGEAENQHRKRGRRKREEIAEITEVAEADFPAHEETGPHQWKTNRRKRADMVPFTGLEEEEEHETITERTKTLHRKRRFETPLPDADEADESNEFLERREKSRQRQRTEMLPFTGLEKYREEDVVSTRREQAVRSGRGTRAIRTHQRGSHHNVGVRRFFGRKQVWLIIGVLALLVLVTAPLLSRLFNNLKQQTDVGTQGVSLAQLQAVPSNPHELVILPANSDHPSPPVYATSAFVLDADTEGTIYSKNPFLHLPMLSTTKLMTASLAVQEGNLDQQVTITAAMEHDIQQLSSDSAIFGVKEGETYSLRDLVYGLLYVSGNDAALVIADAIAGNVEDFVSRMNAKAQELGMNDTHFVNPHGLLNSGQYSTARDLAVLGQYSLSIPIIKEISSGKTYHIAAGGNHDERVILNENQFLWWYPGVDGGKTGFDGDKDFIQVMSVTRSGRHMIGVVMHSNDWWTDMRDLMNYGSGDYTWNSPRDTDNSGQPVPYDNLWNYFASDTQERTIGTADNGQYFIKTGYSVSGPLLDYFNQQGGLDKLGFPIKAPVPSSSTVISQKFERGTIQCDLSNGKCSTV